MTRLVHVTLTAEQIDLIVELLPQPLERALLDEDLSPTCAALSLSAHTRACASPKWPRSTGPT